ncbi:hypothetical protein M378DRAFT_92882 [Amanita muscaria Koide BX008]|uniref:Uncharacterized protein n=1 Tax=Amanita muscaria (strain Koide BX008) TaxID=946122 RepID=A0A0C2VZJ2_AMAMK|nr:hypothetical protein M378DRAFT_92882 [Amanita muscaria Koide BX008]
MYAQNVRERAILWRNAPLHLIDLDPATLRFHRGLLWTQLEEGHSPTALSTTFDPPLPRPPVSEFRPEVTATISAHPELFKIITPINARRLQQLLINHPNQPFVQSEITGLKEGFWPFAHTHPETYPAIHDVSPRPPKTEHQRQFLIDQCRTEVEVERFSPSFGTELLPGMYSMPIHSVPKLGSNKLRLVVDHSFSDHSLNSMIPREEIAGTKLDSIKDLIDSILQFRRGSVHDVKLVLFKSDVSAAYHHLPMHPLWQLKQIITVEGQRYVDRCNNFGNRAAQKLWVSVMALVIWVAIFVRKIDHVKLYTDDAYSFDIADNMDLYEPYNRLMPRKQAQLLCLWDEVGVPHEDDKQVWGETSTIIGLMVDPNLMTVTLPKDKLTDLLNAINDFAYPPDGSRRHSLRRFMQMAGWMNWALNVFPLLKPGLCQLFNKIKEKDKPNALVYLNDIVCFELSWFASHARNNGGIRIMESIAWRPRDANYVFFCDACLDGLGCYLPATNTGFFAAAPNFAPAGNIFFLEALCVCWAIHIAHRRGLTGNIVIFTDNENTVALFNRLHSSIPVYNPFLISAVDILLLGCFRIQVVTIPGEENIVADALSRGRFRFIRVRYPEITLDIDEPLPHLAPVYLPSPPRSRLGAAQC